MYEVEVCPEYHLDDQAIMTHVRGSGVIITDKQEEIRNDERGTQDKEEEDPICYLTSGTSCKRKVLQINVRGESTYSSIKKLD